METVYNGSVPCPQGASSRLQHAVHNATRTINRSLDILGRPAAATSPSSQGAEAAVQVIDRANRSLSVDSHNSASAEFFMRSRQIGSDDVTVSATVGDIAGSNSSAISEINSAAIELSNELTSMRPVGVASSSGSRPTLTSAQETYLLGRISSAIGDVQACIQSAQERSIDTAQSVLSLQRTGPITYDYSDDVGGEIGSGLGLESRAGTRSNGPSDMPPSEDEKEQGTIGRQFQTRGI
ncbi:hypothetical protein [Nocardia wallacei]|uniref:hypothetical protein n=1 Tax=Nocardia wallacei TaxID=480035 RepID=UPI001657456D|nr:hypothetical protein [Nocardia wallacei]